MGNTGEDTVKRSTQTMGSTIVAILLGGTIGLVALFAPHLADRRTCLEWCIASFHGRYSAHRVCRCLRLCRRTYRSTEGEGNRHAPGGGVGSLLCAVLLVICFSTTGVDGLHGQFWESC